MNDLSPTLDLPYVTILNCVACFGADHRGSVGSIQTRSGRRSPPGIFSAITSTSLILTLILNLETHIRLSWSPAPMGWRGSLTQKSDLNVCVVCVCVCRGGQGSEWSVRLYDFMCYIHCTSFSSVLVLIHQPSQQSSITHSHWHNHPSPPHTDTIIHHPLTPMQSSINHHTDTITHRPLTPIQSFISPSHANTPAATP